MKRNILEIILCVFVLVFIISIIPLPASAADLTASANYSAANTALTAVNAASSARNTVSPPIDHFEEAIDLKILGLLANSPDDFELERAPNRVEGAIMLIRLLGKEDEAMQGCFLHPFSDVPSWADKYIGYMYRNDLSKGTEGTLYGSSQPLSAKQYATFVLRALGYKDGTDFSYNQALDKAHELGILTSSDATKFKGSHTFLRDDMVSVSYDALSVKLKGSTDTLLDKLVNTEKAIFKPAAKALGLYTSDLKVEYGNVTSVSFPMTAAGYKITNKEELYQLIRKTLCLNNTSFKIDIRNYAGNARDDFKHAIFDRAYAAVVEITGVEYFIGQWESTLSKESLTLTFEYKFSKSEFNRRAENVRTALNKARYVAAKLITPSMSDFAKEKLLHDYIINNAEYDYQNYLRNTIPDESFEEYGCLVLGIAVCEGYAEAMKLLCDLSGLECIVVMGKSTSNYADEGHAWNIVKIDGEYYHVDVTNNDPVTRDGSNTLTYQYFNLPDSEMALYNSWNRADYPICTGTKNNYYNKCGMVVNDRKAFDKVVLKALDQRRPIIEIKVKDYSKAKYSNISDTIFSAKSVEKYRYSVNDISGIIRLNIQYNS